MVTGQLTSPLVHLSSSLSGMPKEHAAALSLALTPVQIVIPMLVTKYTGGVNPLNLAIKSYIPRLVSCNVALFHPALCAMLIAHKRVFTSGLRVVCERQVLHSDAVAASNHCEKSKSQSRHIEKLFISTGFSCRIVDCPLSVRFLRLTD